VKSTVPWPENSWIPRNFQADLWALQQPHEHSHSLFSQLAHYPFNMLHELFQFILSPIEFLQSTMQQHKSTEMTLERAASHIKVTHPPSLFRLP